jgi:hypothetical protein
MAGLGVWVGLLWASSSDAPLPPRLWNEMPLVHRRLERAYERAMEEGRRERAEQFRLWQEYPALDDALEDAYSLLWAPFETGLDWWRGDTPRFSLREDSSDDKPVTRKITEVSGEFIHDHDNFRRIIRSMVAVEQRSFSKIDASYLYTPAVEAGLAEMDRDLLEYEQSKLGLSLLGSLFTGKYRFGSMPDRTLKEEGYRVSRWRQYDYVAMPPILSLHFFLTGMDQPFTLLGIQGRVFSEPVARILAADGDELYTRAAAGVELALFGPLNAVVSAGRYENGYEIDFIGIATTAASVRKILRIQ